ENPDGKRLGSVAPWRAALPARSSRRLKPTTKTNAMPRPRRRRARSSRPSDLSNRRPHEACPPVWASAKPLQVLLGSGDEKTLDTLHPGRSRLKMQYIDLWGRYCSRSYRSERAREYAVHGFCRRLGMLLRAVDRVFEILPPELEDIPEREDVEDATIAIQSFVLNTFGCFDNLLWVWVFEKDVKEKDGSDL